jgi:tetratricopeptide (TPR) repeat protein
LESTDRKGGLRAAFFYFLFPLAVFPTGEYFQYALGFLRSVAFLWAGIWLWKRRREPVDAPGYAFVVLGFCVLSLGHAFSSVYVWASLQHALNISLAAVLLGWAVLLVREGEGPPARRMALTAMAGVAAIEIAVAVYQRWTVGTTRPHGTFSNPMFLSEYLAVTGLMFLSIQFSRWKEGGRKKVLPGAAAVLLFAGALSLTGSRGVLVALVPALAFLAVLHFGFSRGMKTFLFLCVPAVAILGWHSASRFFSVDVYNYGRIVFWKSALRMFMGHPFGVGLGGYKYLWFSAQEPFPQAFRHFAKYAVTPHNEYLEVLTGLGIVGFALFCAVLFLPMWCAVRAWDDVPADRRGMAAGAFAGLVLSGTNAFFNFNLHEFGNVFTDVLLLGILASCLPGSAFGKPWALPPSLRKAGAVLAIAVGAVSASLLAGAVALNRGEALFRANDLASAEKAFRLAASLDPFRATIPDALSALYSRKYPDPPRTGRPAAVSRLQSSIEWQERASALAPMEQQYLYRLSSLYMERYRQSGERRDLETALGITGKIIEINPYGVEGYWNRAQLLWESGRMEESVQMLRRAVDVEPNFCRGYAKLAELTKGADESQSLGWIARAERCREAARGRTLEENERWLVEEPGRKPEEGAGRNEDGGSGSPPGFSPSR